ncbi:hypothetical protein [Mycobacterium lepromatosis]|uniref:hypothetical protein n=1 Tax=Mycobacterium lepromatosis TaxID=480418 RepID=UPI000679B46E|nr:hypothetical protein [Mycobacterium lepromatosis]
MKALKNHAPLNANEELKKPGNPLNVREHIENIYAKTKSTALTKPLRGLFCWWGLYTQREQAYDGSWTNDENIDRLETEYFHAAGTLRQGARSRLTRFARWTKSRPSSLAIPPTSLIRANVQYLWIEVENFTEISRKLDEDKLQATKACGNCPQVVLG